MTLLSVPMCRNEPAAATPGPRGRFSMWGCNPAEPPTVSQDGARSKPHAAAAPGPNPAPGSDPGRTTGLPGEHRPQRMAPACQHLHQQQVTTKFTRLISDMIWASFNIKLTYISPHHHLSLFVNVMHALWLSLPPPSVYPQQSQSQYSTQPNGGMYSSNNNVNLRVNPMSGQMSSMASMNTEQVRDAQVQMSYLLFHVNA